MILITIFLGIIAVGEAIAVYVNLKNKVLSNSVETLQKNLLNAQEAVNQLNRMLMNEREKYERNSLMLRNEIGILNVELKKAEEQGYKISCPEHEVKVPVEL